MELARVSINMIIWYTLQEIHDHVMRKITIFLLARYDGDIKRAASELKCRPARLDGYLNCTPIIEATGQALVVFDGVAIMGTADGIEALVRVEIIRAAQAILAVLRRSGENEHELGRPAARLLGIEEYNLRRDLAQS